MVTTTLVKESDLVAVFTPLINVSEKFILFGDRKAFINFLIQTKSFALKIIKAKFTNEKVNAHQKSLIFLNHIMFSVRFDQIR